MQGPIGPTGPAGPGAVGTLWLSNFAIGNQPMPRNYAVNGTVSRTDSLVENVIPVACTAEFLSGIPIQGAGGAMTLTLVGMEQLLHCPAPWQLPTWRVRLQTAWLSPPGIESCLPQRVGLTHRPSVPECAAARLVFSPKWTVTIVAVPFRLAA